VLDRPEVLLRGEVDVLHGHVVLEVEPGAALARDMPVGLERGRAVLGLRRGDLGRVQPERVERGGGGAEAVGEAGGGGEDAVRGARRVEARDRARGGDEGGDVLPPHRAAVHVAGEVHRRVPAARDGEAVGAERPVAAGMADRDFLEPEAAPGACDGAAGVARNAVGQARVGAGVDEGRHLDSCVAQVGRGAVGVVVVAEDRDGFSRAYTPSVEVGADRARGHDPGAVVVAEGDVAFVGAAREHGLFRHDPPEALARRVAAGRAVEAGALERAVGAAVVDAGDRGALHQADIRHPDEFVEDGADPLRPGIPSISWVSARRRPPARLSSSARITSAPARAAASAAMRPAGPAPITRRSQKAKALS
jgi:hypothetical protein